MRWAVLCLSLAAILLAGCNRQHEPAASATTAPEQPVGDSIAANSRAADPTEPRTDITGYPGLEFGTPVGTLDDTGLTHGPYADGLYAYEREETLSCGKGAITAQLMYTAIASEPGAGQVEGVVLVFDLKSITWDDPQNPGVPADAILYFRTKLLAEYAPGLIVENTDGPNHMYLELMDAAGDRAWLQFNQGNAQREHHLSLGYRSRALLDYRDKLSAGQQAD